MPTKSNNSFSSVSQESSSDSEEYSSDYEDSEDHEGGVDINEYIRLYRNEPELLQAILLSLNQK
jgi:hypothetical protein